MRVALEEVGSRDTYETGLPKFFDVMGTAITHSCPESSDQLVNNFGYSTLLRDLGDDSLGNEFLDVSLHVLEITVL